MRVVSGKVVWHVLVLVVCRWVVGPFCLLWC